MRPMGTLANGDLRHKRIEAHRALNKVVQAGIMTKHGAYIWLQNRLCLREKDMHIGMFSEYRCEETIRECNILMEQYAKTNRISSCEKKRWQHEKWKNILRLQADEEDVYHLMDLRERYFVLIGAGSLIEGIAAYFLFFQIRYAGISYICVRHFSLGFFFF